MNNQKQKEYNKLSYKLIPDDYLDSSGKIKEEFKYKINIPELKIKDSKFIPNSGDKFETMLFLPPNSNRIAEGGLRIKGLFKFSYKKVKSDFEENKNNASENDGIWYICDLDGNPAIPAPDDLQEKINQYTSNLSPTTFLPLITVITVVYNGAKYLEDTIKSVINQTYPNVEYIIIDGGSTDGTIDIIKKYEDYIDYWVSEPDRGIYDAMNKGIDLVTGEWINFMNAGDKFFNDNTIFFIYQNVKSFDSNYDIVYGKAGVIDEKRELVSIQGLNERESFRKLKKYMSIPHQSTFYRLEFFKKIGKYDDNLKLAGDYEILLRNYKNLQVRFIDSILSLMLSNGIAAKLIDLTINEFTESKLKNKEQINLPLWYIKTCHIFMITKSKIKKFISFMNNSFLR
nr:glycosyltransferase family 2 protein [Sulfurihydrogenibium yellowstonense]